MGTFVRKLKHDDVLAIEKIINTCYFINQVKKVKVINIFNSRSSVSRRKRQTKNDSVIIAFYLSKELFPQLPMEENDLARLKSLEDIA